MLVSKPFPENYCSFGTSFFCWLSLNKCISDGDLLIGVECVVV